MPSFTRLIKFEAGGKSYFTDIGKEEIPSSGTEVKAYSSIDDLVAGENETNASVGKLLAPVPNEDIPIYCVGLNYKSHAEEANLSPPAYPPLWTKPCASLANPEEDIPLNKFCQQSIPDYEGELVFITKSTCKDLTPEAAEANILGYTAGNDISCRIFQLPEKAGGQFYYAKAFDKFAPLGPTLVSPDVFFAQQDKPGARLTTKVNGKTYQDANCVEELIAGPARILSHMSQGTTIPGGTVVMTGTPKGVGVFQDPRLILKHGDVVEVEISGVGVLKNKIVFE